MKLRAFEEGMDDSEKIVYLKLESHDTFVSLVAVDADGDPHSSGSLLKIYPEGIYFEPFVDRSLGFERTGRGHLIILDH